MRKLIKNIRKLSAYANCFAGYGFICSSIGYSRIANAERKKTSYKYIKFNVHTLHSTYAFLVMFLFNSFHISIRTQFESMYACVANLIFCQRENCVYRMWCSCRTLFMCPAECVAIASAGEAGGMLGTMKLHRTLIMTKLNYFKFLYCLCCALVPAADSWHIPL